MSSAAASQARGWCTSGRRPGARATTLTTAGGGTGLKLGVWDEAGAVLQCADVVVHVQWCVCVCSLVYTTLEVPCASNPHAALWMRHTPPPPPRPHTHNLCLCLGRPPNHTAPHSYYKQRPSCFATSAVCQPSPHPSCPPPGTGPTRTACAGRTCVTTCRWWTCRVTTSRC